MKVELFPFQKIALRNLRAQSAEALGSYRRTHTPQVVSFTAPTGAGKTIIMASLIEDILYGNDVYPDQQSAIFVWLSDSPELNAQSRLKIDLKADKIRLDQCVTIDDESFDREILDDGHIYFLNTQKLGRNSNLVRNSDTRQFTIWQTLRNTVEEKSDRLYFIIDEAHRGMQGNAAGRATTIMQKFIKGSSEDGLNPMPVVIGMTATSARFNALVSGTTSTIHQVVVTPDEVRSSGLLKDRIVITFPEDRSGNYSMAVLQAAADEWKDKCDHWNQYCREQHYAYINPVFVVQVQNGTGERISDTDLDDCLEKIEERVGIKFTEGEVVHTFGQTTASIDLNGLAVPYVEPSKIADDLRIRVVFFKENLSTGWDCPRAETMMSFRHASDATYIAQLLGRMVRTPRQQHIQVDDTLNDVRLFLPYFNANTVKQVVDELQSSEGGEIPTDVQSESLGQKRYDIWTVRPVHNRPATPVQPVSPATTTTGTAPVRPSGPLTQTSQQDATDPYPDFFAPLQPEEEQTPEPAPEQEPEMIESPQVSFDREVVMKAINDAGLLTYDVRTVTINNYLTSLFKLARLLSQSQIHREAINDVKDEIVSMIRDHIEGLIESGEYEEAVEEVMKFELSTQTFDVFGERVENSRVQNLFSTTDSDIDRQFRLAEAKLGAEGVGKAYVAKYCEEYDPINYEIDVIIYAADSECLTKLNRFAENKYHELNDTYRRRTITLTDRFRKQYDDIVSDGDKVSKHNFRLPEAVSIEHAANGKRYADHLFVDNTGYAKIYLNGWEEGVLKEEQARSDYVCWLRNPSRKPWSLCIPYQLNGETKSAYPDFIVIRKDDIGYVVDLLEPHDPTREDNFGKAQGFAEYARQNPGVGRIQLIRMGRDGAGRQRFKRLDMSKSLIRDKVSAARNQEELNHIFDTDGFFE